MTALRLLLIEDDADDAALASKLLSAEGGFEVRTVTSSSDLASALTQARFDATVIESKLRWSDVLDVIGAIRKRAASRPIVLFTTDASPAFLSSAMERGLDGWVLKNSRGFVRLPEAVRAALARSARLRSSTDASIHALLDHSGTALFQCSRDGHFVEGNPAFAQLLGLAAAEAMDVNVLERILTVAQRQDLVGRLERERVVRMVDVGAKSKHGMLVPCALTATLTPDGGETLITGLLEPKPEVRSIPEPKEPPSDLMERALGAAHDLKEPLRTIEHYSNVLKTRYAGQLDADADESLTFLHDAARRMKSQIQRLFGETTPKPGQPPMAAAPKAPVSLNLPRVAPPASAAGAISSAQSALDRALANLRASIVSADAQVTHGALPPLPLAEEELAQLFQNLVGNAIKFRSHERPHVHVSAVLNGGEWLVSVEDNGIGIPPDDAPKLFTMFSRGRAAEGRPGSGIGLALCKSIVERAGGRIWAAPNTGRGATFFFALPTSTRLAAVPRPAASGEHTGH